METSGIWLLRTWFLPLVLAFVLGTACADDAPRTSQPVGGGCDGCELMFEGMPRALGWRTAIAAIGGQGNRASRESRWSCEASSIGATARPRHPA